MYFIVICTANLIPVWTGTAQNVTPKGMETSNKVEYTDDLISNGECKRASFGGGLIHFECFGKKYALPAAQCSLTIQK